MATYKVLQDIEAEDKLLGPLTLKQFIFAIITISLSFMAYLFYKINFVLAIPWLLPISFFGFMATPISKDQPNDVWLAARIRFLIKPRKRVWDQDGMQELVTITVPKKIEINRTDGLSQTEVKSRLSALSSLMDTRGWAIKNVSDMMAMNAFGRTTQGDRLLELSNLSPDNNISDVSDRDDMLDPLHNMIAQRIDSAIKQQQADRINTLKNDMRSGAILEQSKATVSQQPPASKQDYSFINQPQALVEPGYATFGARVVSPGAVELNDSEFIALPATADESDKALLDKIHRQKVIQDHIAKSSHEHKINPAPKEAEAVQKKPELTSAHTAPDAILKQLGQANDLSVASLANLAKHAEQESSFKDNDVISLH